jgi:hypothetical protein
MKPDEIDNILAQAAQRAVPPDADRSAIERARSLVLQDLQPARPLRPVWVFTLALVALFALLGTAAATGLGLHGLHVLNPGQRAAIFSALLAAAWLSAVGCARTMRPAAGLRLGPLALIAATAGFPVLFSLLFSGYGTGKFVHEGIPCLVAGMCVAIPTGLVAIFILRRGYVLQWSSAGIATGALAGLTGLATLELHCPNLKAIHVMVWHVAVVLLSGALGWAIGRGVDLVHGRRKITANGYRIFGKDVDRKPPR